MKGVSVTLDVNEDGIPEYWCGLVAETGLRDLPGWASITYLKYLAVIDHYCTCASEEPWIAALKDLGLLHRAITIMTEGTPSSPSTRSMPCADLRVCEEAQVHPYGTHHAMANEVPMIRKQHRTQIGRL